MFSANPHFVMESEQKINPWEVQKSTTPGSPSSIDYNKIIDQFGCQKITNELVERLERITHKRAHHLIRRRLVFAHRDFDKILDLIEKGSNSLYLYTGRGPSSQSMHIGHAVPFLFCKYLQEVFDVPLVIQLTDDEKFLWKNLTYDEAKHYAKENIKDIIAFGFDPKKTFIFTNTEYAHNFVENTLKIGRSVSFKEAAKVFGFDDSFSISQIEFPAKEIAPCFSSSFDNLDFLKKGSHCLIPAAIDQDPFFRLARDKAHLIGGKKPATIYSGFMPDLSGGIGKMSASDELSSIFLSDSGDIIKKKINKYAFSGGKDTLEEHRKFGGNTDVDTSYQFLRYFLEDDDELQKIENEYSNGTMTSGEMKMKCITVISNFVEQYQAKRSVISPETVNLFMSEKRSSN